MEDNMEMDNRLFENLKAGRPSVGCVVTSSDLTVSELAGDWGAMASGIRAFRRDCDKAIENGAENA